MNNKSLRIIFAGTTNFSAYYLNTLINSFHKVIAIFTQKYSPATYEKQIYISSIYEIAKKNKLLTFQLDILNTNEIIKIIKYLNPDIIIIVAYGLIIPETILNLPPLGCINVHGSLLPRWRGAAPIQRAIESGDSKTGVSIIQINSGIDTGNILHKSTCNIFPNDTSLSIYKKLTNLGSEALLYTLKQITSGTIHSTPQNNTLATYAKKINKIEGKINWNISTIELERRIRAFNPWPISYFHIHGKKIKILETTINNINKHNFQSIIPGTILVTQKEKVIIATKDGSIILKTVQLEGKKIMPIQELLKSKKHWFIPGTILDSN